MKLANMSFVFTFTEEKLQWKIEYKDNRDHIEIRDNGKTLKKDAVYNNVPIKLLNTCSEKIKRTYKIIMAKEIKSQRFSIGICSENDDHKKIIFNNATGTIYENDKMIKRISNKMKKGDSFMIKDSLIRKHENEVNIHQMVMSINDKEVFSTYYVEKQRRQLLIALYDAFKVEVEVISKINTKV